MLCRETPARGVEFLLQAKADPGNIGYLQFCPTIQSTWENIRGLKGARRAPFAECLEASDNIRVIYKSKHNEEGSRFWQKSNENMILFVEDTGRLEINEFEPSMGQPVPDQGDDIARQRHRAICADRDCPALIRERTGRSRCLSDAR